MAGIRPLPDDWTAVLSAIVGACDDGESLRTAAVASLVRRSQQSTRSALRGLRRRGYVSDVRDTADAPVAWTPTDLGRRYIWLMSADA